MQEKEINVLISLTKDDIPIWKKEQLIKSNKYENYTIVSRNLFSEFINDPNQVTYFHLFYTKLLKGEHEVANHIYAEK